MCEAAQARCFVGRNLWKESSAGFGGRARQPQVPAEASHELEAGESSNRAVGWEGNPRAVPPHEYRAQAEPLNPIGPRDSRESCNPSSPEVTVVGLIVLASIGPVTQSSGRAKQRASAQALALCVFAVSLSNTGGVRLRFDYQ